MEQLEFLLLEFFENTVKNYLIFSAILLIGLLLKGKLSSFIRKWIYKIVGDSTNPDGKVEFDNLLKKPISYFILLIVLYFSFNSLSFPSSWNLTSIEEVGIKMVLEKGSSLLIVVTIFWTMLRSVEYLGIRLKHKASLTESRVDDQIIPFAIEIARVLVIIFGVLIILSNIFGVNITALAAGLGLSLIHI